MRHGDRVAKRPWGKWFWSDWMADTGLRRSSYAARGLWIDMLCIAAEGDPIGYLVVKGEPLSPGDLARMTGGDPTEVATLLNELDRNGVLSRDRNGTIYNRRMVREAKKLKASAKGGKKGGKVTYEKQTGIFGTQGVTQEATQGTTQAPYAICQSNSEPKGSALAGEWSDDRATLFGGALQWLKKQTSRSEKACRTLIGKWLKLTADDATAVLGVIRQARDRNIIEPVAWIEAALAPKTDGTAPDWEARARYFGETGRWLDEWGRRGDVPPEYEHLFESMAA